MTPTPHCTFCGRLDAFVAIGLGKSVHPSCVVATVAKDISRFDAQHPQLRADDGSAKRRSGAFPPLDLAAFPAGEAALFPGLGA